MGLAKFFLHLKTITEIEDTVETYWQKENIFYNINFQTITKKSFSSIAYGKGKYIYNNIKPVLYDEDWIKKNDAKNYILIASQKNFESIEIICAELSENIRKLSLLYNKCEMDLPKEYQELMEKHQYILYKVHFSDRYVVE